jgi:radical SAM-linked protein
MDRASAEHDSGGARPEHVAEAAGISGNRASAGGGDRVASRQPGTRLPAAGPEMRQRWRVTFARDEMSSERVGRSLLDDWHEALRTSGLPVAMQDGDAGRPKLAFAAPLPASARGEAELVDLWLVERLPLWRVRESLGQRLPTGHRWVSAEDIWLGAPPLPGQVSAAEWRIELAPLAGANAAVVEAARALLASTSLPRAREKGGVSRRYDLRPLISDVALEPGSDAALRIVTRFDPILGTGRPEEIVAVLAERAQTAIDIRSMVRKRLILTEPALPAVRPAAGEILSRRPLR